MPAGLNGFSLGMAPFTPDYILLYIAFLGMPGLVDADRGFTFGIA
jgi:hypothetical protein